MYFWNLTSQIGPIKHFYFIFDVFFLHRTADLWKNTKPIPFIKSEKKKLWTPLIINTVIITNPMRQWFEGIHHIRAPEKKCASDLQFSQLLSFSLFRFITNYFSIKGWKKHTKIKASNWMWRHCAGFGENTYWHFVLCLFPVSVSFSIKFFVVDRCLAVIVIYLESIWLVSRTTNYILHAPCTQWHVLLCLPFVV